jgi:hypothetical protein
VLGLTATGIVFVCMGAPMHKPKDWKPEDAAKFLRDSAFFANERRNR